MNADRRRPPGERAGESPPVPAGRRVRKGVVGPPRAIPGHIARPEYAQSGVPVSRQGGRLRTPEQIERMRRAGQAARQVLDEVTAAVRPGATTDQLDAIAHAATLRLGGYPSPLNYHRYPKSLCTSVNEVICHGIPDSTRLVDGDIINCDVTIYLGGVHGDCSETVFVGHPEPASARLVQAAYESMLKGIEVIRPGARLNAIGRAIERHVGPLGFSVVRAFTGHGIGEHFHMDPHVFHYYDPQARLKLEAGMVFTVEPMINEGTWRCRVWDDDWTAVTADGRRSAQFEHTLLVTESGSEILTSTDRGPLFERQLAALGR